MVYNRREIVDISDRQDEPSIPADPVRVDKTRRRPIRAIGLLLILQAIGLTGIGAYELVQVDWQQIDPEAPSQQAMEAAAYVFFAPPAILALVASLGFLFLSRRGWLLAAIAEGLCLGVSLWLYSELKPVAGILMIFYRNSQDVRVVFHSRRDAAKRGLEKPRGS